MTLFSAIIATRNRPELFNSALASVLRQHVDLMEIIIVDDGSDDAYRAEYQRIVNAATRPIQYYSLIHRPNGHGPSYAINYGVSMAKGQYVCFLDDDDNWTDDGYLARIATTISSRYNQPDLVFSNQTAFFRGLEKTGPIWLAGLARQLARTQCKAEADGFFNVSVLDLLNSGGFCHMNTMIVRRALFEMIGGLDEDIRWEGDHDLFLRLIDKAERMLFSPTVVSRHNIPDPAKSASVTTALDELQRRLYQLRVFDKASLYAEHVEIRDYGRRCKGYTLKRIAERLVNQGDYRTAAFYARQALGAAPTVKWTLYMVLVLLRSLRKELG